MCVKTTSVCVCPTFSLFLYMPSIFKELGTDKVDTNESEVLAANIAGKGSVHSVHELEETKEFVPPFDSTHVGQGKQYTYT